MPGLNVALSQDASACPEPSNLTIAPAIRALETTLEQVGDMALENRVRLEADGVLVALGLKEVVEIRQRDGKLVSSYYVGGAPLRRRDLGQHCRRRGGLVLAVR